MSDTEKENLEKIDDEDEDDDDYHLDDDKDSDYGSGEENNDSALNTSAESNYERYEGGTLT